MADDKTPEPKAAEVAAPAEAAASVTEPAADAPPAAAASGEAEKKPESNAEAKADEPMPDASDEAERIVILAGRKFASKTEIADHVKKIQDAVGDDEEGKLPTEACLFLFHLFLHHPRAVEKMDVPISHFRYGMYGTFKNKCFIMVREDGTQEGVSATKSIQQAWADSDPNAEPAQEARGVKRDRDEDERPPKQFEPMKMEPGCVLDIKGCPADVNFGMMKDLLAQYGRVCYVQLIGNAKRARTESRRGNHKDDTMVAAAGGDDADKSTKPEADAEKSEGTTEAASGGAGETKIEDESKAESKPEAGTETKVEAPAAEESKKDDESAQAPEEANVVARCRFSDAEAAKKALEEVKEVSGAKVTTVLLTGADEEAYWAEMNAKLKDNFENGKGKGKGKDKGKGKGKDKGKGKGKGKGKKGKKDRD